jgi:hypothetical protein
MLLLLLLLPRRCQWLTSIAFTGTDGAVVPYFAGGR